MKHIPILVIAGLAGSSVGHTNPGSIAQTAYLKASNTSPNNYFGDSVALWGDTLVVGAPSAGSGGAAYVFVRNGTTWSQQAYLTGSNTESNNITGGDAFGTAVAISGDTVVIGAAVEDSNAVGVNGNQNNNAFPDSGAAYVFVRNGTNWTQQAYLKASNTDAYDRFGSSVAASGDTVVIGAHFEDSRATGVNGNQSNQSGNFALESGAAYVFVRNGTNWSQQAYLKASNTQDDFLGDYFGYSVAVSGDTVVVGASLEDSSATGVNGDQNNNDGYVSGAAYVFVRSGTNWTQEAYLKASNTGVADEFGYAVAISGDTVVIGANGEGSNATGVNGNQYNEAATNSGAAYVFVRNGTNWSQQAYLKASNTQSTDFFSVSVAVSGDTVVVGAYEEDSNATGVDGDQNNNGAPSSGAAYVFLRDGTNWSHYAYLKASNTGANDLFGNSVAVSGDTVVIGAFLEDSDAVGVNGNQNNNAAPNSGAAYVFTRCISVSGFPAIAGDPPDRAIFGGSSVTFTVHACGNALSYQWRKGTTELADGGRVSGATTANLLLTDLQLSDAGAYSVIVSNSFGAVTSSVAMLQVLPLQIVQHPQSRTNVAGTTATFSVTANGNQLTYEWQKGNVVLVNGGRVSGARTTNLVVANVQPSDAGPYTVIVSNSFGSVTSQVAQLEVIDLGSGADATNLVWTSGGNALWLVQGAITHDGADALQSGAILGSQESWLQTSITGPGTLAFWWKVSSVMDYDFLEFSIDGVAQQRISGEENWAQPSFAINAGTHTFRWRYAKDTSSTALGQDRGWVDEVVFLPDSGAPMILAQPASRRVGLGDTITLAPGVGGAKPRAHQWFFNGNLLAGATNASLTLSNVGTSQAGSYHLAVSNASGSTTSSNGVLTVATIGPVANVLLLADDGAGSPYRAALNNLGRSHQLFADSIAFNAAVSNANPATTLVVVDSHFGSHALNAVGQFANAGGRALLQYWGMARQSALAPAFNAQVNLVLQTTSFSVVNWGGSMFFAGLPNPVIVFGSSQRLTTLAGGQAVAGFSDTPMPDWAAIVIGHSGRTIVNGCLLEEIHANFRVRLAQNQLDYLLQLAPPVLVIVTQPVNKTVQLGGRVTNTVAAVSPTGTLNYQWRLNGTDISSSTNATATNSSLVITNTQLAHEGIYSVVVSDTQGSVTSSNATLTVLIRPEISQHPLSQKVVIGDAVTFSLAVSNTATLPITYRWRQTTNVLIESLNEHRAFFTITNVQTNHAGNYTVVVTNLAGSAPVSSAAVLTVLPDTDGDHIPDEWEAAYPDCADPALDCDNDGATNLEEYQAGTNPTNAASALRITGLTAGPPTVLEFQAVSNKTYTAQHTDRLESGAWSNLVDVVARSTNRNETVTDSALATNRSYRIVTPRQP